MIYDFKAVAQLNKGDDISSSGKTLYSTIWANETRAGASCTVESPCFPSPPRYSEKEPHKLLPLLCSAGKQTKRNKD